MEIKNKVFIVTGAASGIGKELTLQLINKGAKVAAIDIHLDELENLKKSINTNALSIHQLDIASKAEVESLPEAVIKIHGSLDGIINNAGIIQPFIKIQDLDFEHINKVMQINFYGPLYLIKASLPYLLKRPEAYIVNISSMGGFLPVPGQSIYGASKAAIKLMTESLYAELIHTPVRVMVVFPGATTTNIMKNSGLDFKLDANTEKQASQALPASKAAELIIQGIQKNKVRIFTGSDSKMMDILYRIAPVFAIKFIQKQMKGLLKE